MPKANSLSPRKLRKIAAQALIEAIEKAKQEGDATTLWQAASALLRIADKSERKPIRPRPQAEAEPKQSDPKQPTEHSSEPAIIVEEH